MARWEPDARGRLRIAALELYAERGYERTTVADIAERASVTERTYFRHFADKREVLCDGTNEMQEAVAAALESVPASESPMEAAARAVVEGTVLLDGRRPSATTRARVIGAEPSLRERELLKMSNLTATTSARCSRRCRMS